MRISTKLVVLSCFCGLTFLPSAAEIQTQERSSPNGSNTTQVFQSSLSLPTETEEDKHKQELLKTIVRFNPDERIFGYNPTSKYAAKAYKNQQCQLFRIDDTKRQQPLATLETIDGNGFVYPLPKQSLEQLETIFGKSRDRVYLSPGTSGFDTMVNKAHEDPDYSRRIFDLLAYSTLSEPTIFHLTVTFKDGLADTYTIDGPGIKQVLFKYVTVR